MGPSDGCVAVAAGLSRLAPARDPLPHAGDALLGIGAALGPWLWNVVPIDPLRHAAWLHRASEIGVIVSLFTVGLKVRLSLRDARWWPPVVLATVAMVLTVALLTGAGWGVWHLPLGAAVLLGAILAPTDPVLASDVQLRHPHDRDRLRFTLSVEAGLNDGTAFPLVMLGLGLLGLHELGAVGWRWWTVDVLWAIGAGLGVGYALGYAVGRWLLHLGTEGREGTGVAVYLVGGTIGVSYAGAIFLHAYGFLAVFAAAVALRTVERHATNAAADAPIDSEVSELQPGEPVNRPKAAVHFTAALLRLSEYLERLLEIGLVLLVGASLGAIDIRGSDVLLAAVLVLVLRPLAVLPLVWLRRFSRSEMAAIGWFGIRGIGSIYYLMYATEHGLAPPLADRLIAMTLTVVAFSIVVHGLSVAPLLGWMQQRQDQAAAASKTQPRREGEVAAR